MKKKLAFEMDQEHTRELATHHRYLIPAKEMPLMGWEVYPPAICEALKRVMHAGQFLQNGALPGIYQGCG